MRSKPALQPSGAPASPIGRRVHVIGNAAAGKSTLAKRLAAALDAEFVELDALNWLPGWVGFNETDPGELTRRDRHVRSGHGGRANEGSSKASTGISLRFTGSMPRLSISSVTAPSSGSDSSSQKTTGETSALPSTRIQVLPKRRSTRLPSASVKCRVACARQVDSEGWSSCSVCLAAGSNACNNYGSLA